MNPSLPELIIAVVSYVTQHGGYITKTKLLKLLYLSMSNSIAHMTESSLQIVLGHSPNA